MSDPLLEVRNLHVHFNTYEGVAEVINGVDFTIEEGETAALVGETGCGKSVTMKTIMGLLPNAIIPEGEIYFKGQDLLTHTQKERQLLRGNEMSMIMQDPMSSLNPVFTVGEQMMDVLKWQGYTNVGVLDVVRSRFRDHSRHRDRCIEMLEEVQISAPERVFESYPSELSGGMRQRILIAIALLTEPEFLIADEPGTALDVTTEKKILDLLDELVDETGASVLYITHDIGVARQVSERINVMYAGEVVENAPTEKLFENPQHPYTRGLLESVPQLSKDIGEGIEGSIPSYVDPPEACRFADRCPHAEPECKDHYPYRRNTSPVHSVACHLWDGSPTFERHQAEAVESDVYIGPPPWRDGHGDQQAAYSDGGYENE